MPYFQGNLPDANTWPRTFCERYQGIHRANVPGWTLSNGWPGTLLGVIMRVPKRTSLEEARVAETLKKGSRVTGAAREKLAADLKKKYDSGASIRALAEETGRSYGFVHRMLSESGVTLRGRGGATRGKKAAAA